MNPVADDVVSKVVRFPVGVTAADAAAGQPDAEATRVVVATVIVRRQFALAVDRAAEFGQPDDQGFVEQALSFEVADQTRASVVDVAALFPQVRRQVAVLVPSAMEDLDKPHAALDHPAGEQTVRGERAGTVDVGPVHRLGRHALGRRVGQFGDGQLHAGGQFVLRDPRFDLRIGDGVEVSAVEFFQTREHAAAGVAGDAAGVGQVQHGIADAAQRDALVTTG